MAHFNVQGKTVDQNFNFIQDAMGSLFANTMEPSGNPLVANVGAETDVEGDFTSSFDLINFSYIETIWGAFFDPHHQLIGSFLTTVTTANWTDGTTIDVGTIVLMPVVLTAPGGGLAS